METNTIDVIKEEENSTDNENEHNQEQILDDLKIQNFRNLLN